MKDSCELCAAAATRGSYWRGRGLLLTADGHPVLGGHELLMPYAHILSMAHYAEGPDGFLELISAIAAYERRWGPAMAYEHGNAFTNLTASRSIDHAHMHLVPLRKTPLAPISERLPGAWRRFSDLAAALELARGIPYHMLFSRASGPYLSLDALPSQVFRRCLAEAAGLSNWDWRSR